MATKRMSFTQITRDILLPTNTDTMHTVYSTQIETPSITFEALDALQCYFIAKVSKYTSHFLSTYVRATMTGN